MTKMPLCEDKYVVKALSSNRSDEHAPVFDEKGIDFSVLLDLTDRDFRELGVLLGTDQRPTDSSPILRPTLPELMDLPKPAEMTGTSLQRR